MLSSRTACAPHHAMGLAPSLLHRRASGVTTRVAEQPVLVTDGVLATGFSGDDDGWGQEGWSFNEDGVMVFQRQKRTAKVMAPPGARPILILPGFGNNTDDYEAPFGKAQGSFASNLRARGFQVRVAQVERKDWFRVAQALLTLGWWRASLTTHPGYTWYLDRVAEAVAQLQEETGADKVDLVGHSAGGWLGRAFLGDPKYQISYAGTGSLSTIATSISNATNGVTSSTSSSTSSAMNGGSIGSGLAARAGNGATAAAPVGDLTPHPAIGALVTLGTPQRPPPGELVRDMTGGAQAWVHTRFPGAYFAPQGVSYVCVGGVAVRGRRDLGPDGKPVRVKDRPRLPREYAHDSYNQVCGQGQGTEGDAVVPLCSAFLAGARHVLLPGVWHSMSRIGTFEEEAEVPWYGSDLVVDQWLAPYLQEAYPHTSSTSNGNGTTSNSTTSSSSSAPLPGSELN